MQTGQIVAKYPFVPPAREFLKEQRPTRAQLEDAARFVLQVALGKRRDLPKAPSPENAVSEFTLSKLVAASAGWPSQYRFAANYLKLVRLELEAASPAVITSIATLYFPSLRSLDETFHIPAFQFLSQDAPLLDKQLEHGMVILSKDEIAAIIAEKARERITSEVDTAKLPQEFAEAAAPVKHLLSLPEKQKGALKYLDVNCVRKALEGTPEGKRYYGAMALSIACLKDGVQLQEAGQILSAYAEKCAKGTHEYSAREALATLDWVYKHPGIGFSCNITRLQGLAHLQCECVGCPLNETERGNKNTKRKQGRKQQI